MSELNQLNTTYEIENQADMEVVNVKEEPPDEFIDIKYEGFCGPELVKKELLEKGTVSAIDEDVPDQLKVDDLLKEISEDIKEEMIEAESEHIKVKHGTVKVEDLGEGCSTSGSEPLELERRHLGYTLKKKGKDSKRNIKNTLEVEEMEINFFHEDPDTRSITDKLGRRRKIRPKKVNIVKCESCDFQTLSKQALRNHRFTHQMEKGIAIYSCEVEGCPYKTLNSKNLRFHAVVHKNESEVVLFKCSECDYQTRYKKCINNHMLTHKSESEIEIHKCCLCSYYTKYKTNLERHVLNHQNDYACEHCDFKTKNRNTLKTHFQIHKKELRKNLFFQCPLCAYNSRSKNNYQKHQDTHRQPEEWELLKCEMCSFKTRYQKSFLKHLQRHQNPEDVEWFYCPDCNYKTRDKICLKKHSTRHTKNILKCNLCMLQTKSKVVMKKHMQTKHGFDDAMCENEGSYTVLTPK